MMKTKRLLSIILILAALLPLPAPAAHAGLDALEDGGWSALGSGTESDVTTLAMAGNNLYVGGLFWEAGGVSARYIAKWTPTTYQYIYLPMVRK